jgi:hypothetical protein
LILTSELRTPCLQALLRDVYHFGDQRASSMLLNVLDRSGLGVLDSRVLCGGIVLLSNSHLGEEVNANIAPCAASHVPTCAGTSAVSVLDARDDGACFPSASQSLRPWDHLPPGSSSIHTYLQQLTLICGSRTMLQLMI